MLFINNVAFLTIILNGVLCFVPKSLNDLSLLSVAASSNGVIDGTPTTISKPNNNLVRGIIGGGGIGGGGIGSNGVGNSVSSITPTEISRNSVGVRSGRDVSGGNDDNFQLQDTIPYEKNDRSVYDPGVNDVVMGGQHHHYQQQQQLEQQQQQQSHHYNPHSSFSHIQQNPTVDFAPSFSLLPNQHQNHLHYQQQQAQQQQQQHQQHQQQQQQQNENANRQINSNIDNENRLQLNNGGVNILTKLHEDIKEEEDIAIKSALLLQLLEKSNLDSPLPIIYVENDDDEATKIAKLQQQQRLWQTTGIGDYDNDGSDGNNDDDTGDNDNDDGSNGIDIGNDINDDSNQMLEKRSGRYYRRYPWKRQNTRYRTYEADTRYLCNPSREDVFKLLVGLHENRNGNQQRVINFCNKKRPAKAIFTNIRFLG